MSKVYCKGYNTTVHTYWGKGQAVFSHQAVRAAGGLTTIRSKPLFHPFYRGGGWSPEMGRSLIRVPARLGLFLCTIQVFLLEASFSAWGSVSQSVREQVISWAPVIDAHYCTQHPEKVIRELLPFAQCSWTVSDFSISKHEIVQTVGIPQIKWMGWTES